MVCCPGLRVQSRMSTCWRVRDLYGPDGTHAPREPIQQPGCIDFPAGWTGGFGLRWLIVSPLSNLGGQRQRTAIARTLSLQHDLLLMDEPFSHWMLLHREGLPVGLILNYLPRMGRTPRFWLPIRLRNASLFRVKRYCCWNQHPQ